MRVLYDFVYPDAKKYKGKAKHLVFSVKIKAPVVPVGYIKDAITNATKELRHKGYEPLRIVVFEDKPKNMYIFHVWYYRKYGRFAIPLVPVAIALAFVAGMGAYFAVSEAMKPKEEDWVWTPEQAGTNPMTLAISPWILFGIGVVLIGGAFLLKQLR